MESLQVSPTIELHYAPVPETPPIDRMEAFPPARTTQTPIQIQFGSSFPPTGSKAKAKKTPLLGKKHQTTILPLRTAVPSNQNEPTLGLGVYICYILSPIASYILKVARSLFAGETIFL
jgi:hypothetical protein